MLFQDRIMKHDQMKVLDDLGNIDSVYDFDTNILWRVLAGTVFTSVRVCFLSVKTTIELNVLKSLGWQSSIAAKVIERSGTINKLLLR